MLRLLTIAMLLATPTAAVGAEPGKYDPARVRCKRIAETGSFVKKKRVCHTEAEWRELQEDTDRQLDAMNDAARINSMRPPK